ncbi:MAG: hypothetical protein JOZ39_12310, partial [Chloroflexi bacterium]|nr:hypothetical protein [Chloroflexota bacterium]
MSRTYNLAAQLRSLPQFRPDPVWKRRTKRRLLETYSLMHAKIGAFRNWAVYATYDPEPIAFASRIRARGTEWRPL